MFLRLILFALLGYFIFKTIRQWLLGTSSQPKVKNSQKTSPDDDFQQKNQSKIEDADFEEID